MTFRAVLAALVILAVTGCGSPSSPGAGEALGEWEKSDNLLPPINLLLTRGDDRVLARLRLSGVELNGTATFPDGKLRLSFPGRQDVTGEFLSPTELKLLLEGVELLLKKRV